MNGAHGSGGGCGCGCGGHGRRVTLQAAGTGSSLEQASVNDVIAAWPETVTVFDRYGIDSCCGGGLSLAVVAERHGLDLRDLLQELTAAGAIGD